ncbi:DELTA-actitoxin-Aeq1c-like [Malaclemys terrapin pileata]|uniref:DELTA-actitoxin-Aeq1c-like n=1 Tax=Malaclemys terrapin pileata TaxID=2991368 RepID=UPI0023A86847|nr:DELTA-actitoxin-Aeq1c-like [Malaclemys terrapin pileata]
MIELVPQIPPGSSGSFLFVKTRYTARGSVGVLSYMSNAFTLAIMFSNPFDRLLYDMEFALELFTGRKHFHSMDRLYHYMYSHDPPYMCDSFQKRRLTDAKDGQLEVTSQEIKVTATMSNQKKSIIKVQIEDRDHCPSYAAHAANLEGTEE